MHFTPVFKILIRQAFSILAAVSMFGRTLLANPIRRSANAPSIDNPCGRDLSATGEFHTLSLPEEIRLLISDGIALNRSIDDSMEAYRQHNLLIDAEIEMLRSQTIGIPFRSENLPEDVDVLMSIELRRAYLQAGIHLYRLEAAIQGGIVCDLPNDHSLLVTKAALSSLMCRLETMSVALASNMTTEKQRQDDEIAPLDYQLIQQLKEDYHSMSIFLAYLHHFQRQLLNLDGNLLKTEFADVERAVLSFVCPMDTILRQKGAEVSRKLADDSDIPGPLKDMTNSKYRYYRDFILLKDLKNFVGVAVGHFKRVLGYLSSQS